MARVPALPRIALAAAGKRAGNALAFLRSDDASAAITIVPIRASSLLENTEQPHVAPATWDDTHVTLPAAQAKRQWHNRLTGEPVTVTDDRLRLAEALKTFPVALLAAD